MTGLFVVFEGGDCVGKTTQVRYLQQWLSAANVAHLLTREPGGTAIGQQLRQMVLDPASGDISARAEALLYAADKAQHVHQLIIPALERGEVVVCDRYVDSMIAYQGAGRTLDIAETAKLAWWAVDQLTPDLTILLDADPKDAVATIAVKDRLEDAGLEFHLRARQHFLDLAAADPQRYLVLNARAAREEIAHQVAQRVEQMLTARGIEIGGAHGSSL